MMKSALPFLFFAFFTNLPLALSQTVLDIDRNPIFPGHEYYILPALGGPQGGGLKLAQTGNSDCPATILQDSSPTFHGFPVKLSPSGGLPMPIRTEIPVKIEFIETQCGISQWSVFEDEEIQKTCVGIGEEKGFFKIQKFDDVKYKLGFCNSESGSCLDIGRFDANNGEDGSRLVLTDQDDPFLVVFVPANPDFDAGIKSIA